MAFISSALRPAPRICPVVISTWWTVKISPVHQTEAPLFARRLRLIDHIWTEQSEQAEWTWLPVSRVSISQGLLPHSPLHDR
ncbi:hypothetical protein AOLI_G00329950 [Acnodon oligacanthus]